jgi:hypothetical protein
MLLGKNPFANSRSLPSVIGFWAVGEDFFPDSRIFLLGKSFFANSSGLGCWESSGLLAKPQFPVVCPLIWQWFLASYIQIWGSIFHKLLPRIIFFFRLCIVRIKQTNADGESAVQSVLTDHHEMDDYLEPSMLGNYK